MQSIYLKRAALFVAFVFTLNSFGSAQTATRKAGAAKQATTAASSLIKENNVRAEMYFLASDAMQGRGSGTQYEWLAGQYIGSQLQQFGVEPAGETDASGMKTYLQTVNTGMRNSFTENPRLSYTANGAPVSLQYGRDMIALRMNKSQVAGALQKISVNDTPKAGMIAFIKFGAGDDPAKFNERLRALSRSGAAAIVVEETPQWRTNWDALAAQNVSFLTTSNSPATSAALIVVSKEAAAALAQIPEGTQIDIKGTLGAPQQQQTWNAVGKITGSDPKLSPEVILLSAHMDHLGVNPSAKTDDKIFNGADDDASGCVAVLEMARVLASGAKPKRTVYFVFFGSEEAGGYGAQYFVNNLPFPQDKLVANLEFEMIGRPDALVKPEELWLTGYDRSDLGAELARRGAKLVNDPHPEQDFFRRSDNYTLARKGIIAHTVSSFGLHTDYHQASDEIKTIDFAHMTRSINSMVSPIQWLVNSNFKPVWYEGKKP